METAPKIVFILLSAFSHFCFSPSSSVRGPNNIKSYTGFCTDASGWRLFNRKDNPAIPIIIR